MNSKLRGDVALLCEIVLVFKGRATVKELAAEGWTEEMIEKALRTSRLLTAKRVGDEIIVRSRKREGE